MNWSSPTQLRELLFKQLNLPVIKTGKTGASTAVDVLQKLQNKHPIIPMILKHRALSKLLSTYTKDWIAKIHPSDKRLHAEIVHTGTETGRISMRNPNLMQIPKHGDNAKFIRKSICASGGHILVEADFSQMDLRILAHESEDKELIRAFKAGEDIHDATAKLLKCDRQKAKQTNFGIVYGKTAFGFAKDWNISKEEAQRFLNKYFQTYWGVKQWMKKIILLTKKNGYVTTLTGRRRYVSNINSSNPYESESAERQAWNTICQGGTADVTKIAMLKVAKWLPFNMEMLVQIHDSLIFERENNNLIKQLDELQNIMEKAVTLKVPIKVNIAVGVNLAEMKNVKGV